MALFASPFHAFDTVFSDAFSHPFHRPRSRRRVWGPDPFRVAHRDPFVRFVLTDDAMDTDDVPNFDPEVSETDEGYLVSATCPGVRPEDLAVVAKPERGLLTVRSEKHPHVRADLRLPTGGAVDASNISASCIDGVLRIIVPKVAPKSELIRVDSAPATAMLEDAKDAEDAEDAKDAEDAHDDGETIVINVPGFSKHDISISRKRPAETLLVEGSSRALGGRKFRRVLALADPEVTVKAWCVDGLLTIRVVNPHATGVNVPVSATPLGLPAPADANENADDADKIDGDKVTLIQRAVPGVSAADFTVEIDRKNTLTARADASTRFGRRRYSFSVALPKNVDKATVAAEVVNGCLTVCAAKPAAPERITVAVRGDVPASLPSAADKIKDDADANDGAVPVVEVDGMVEDVTEEDGR